MKCPRCWAEKAYLRKVGGLQGFLIDCALLAPMKCHHCYHKFLVSWFSTIGKRVQPPKPRKAPTRRTTHPTPSPERAPAERRGRRAAAKAA